MYTFSDKDVTCERVTDRMWLMSTALSSLADFSSVRRVYSRIRKRFPTMIGHEKTCYADFAEFGEPVISEFLLTFENDADEAELLLYFNSGTFEDDH
jgi:hypothetical protein